MEDLIRLAGANLISPMILFFALGVLAGRARSDLSIPESLGKGLALYLMLAIGFKGGAELAGDGDAGSLAIMTVMALALSFLLPVVAYALLRSTTRLGVADAAAVAAHYGSVSVVTFVAAVAMLTQRAVDYEPQLVAMLALMETPAIFTGLLLARRGAGEPGRRKSLLSGEAAREVFLSGGVVLLIGSLAIGWITGPAGMETMAPVIAEPFRAVLAVFLLDMGLLVGRRLRDFGALGWPVFAFGFYMPLIGAAAGLACGYAAGLSVGGTTLFAVLAASASYIVVPAAMRLSLPDANPAIYVPLSMTVTFPFNLVFGIPLYHAAATALAAP